MINLINLEADWMFQKLKKKKAGKQMKTSFVLQHVHGNH